MSDPTLVLASSSLQRKALLQQIGLNPICVAADIDETRRTDEVASEYVQRLATEKCLSVLKPVLQQYPDAVVIGADTIISIADHVLGKAENLEQATGTLSLLSGSQHSVFTGVTVAAKAGKESILCETTVDFAELSRQDIQDYWASGEPLGKAGCYAIQGLGAVFVKAIQGSYSNVVGLPLHEVATLLRRFHVTTCVSTDAR